ncbi:MAG: triose-phosphate isomerase [Desulfococcaceae bacterium]
MARAPFIAGNWKLHKTVDEARESARELNERVRDVRDVEVMIAPPFTALAPVAAELEGGPVSLGAQNLFWEETGAYTGEVSGPMLASAGCRYVIIGHSERRQFFGETDETVNRRLRAALRAGLRPILCVGETEGEREAEKTFSVLDKQLRNGVKGLLSNDLADLVIAYEPVWAIGTGKTATREQAQEAHQFLRKTLSEIFDSGFAEARRIQYGGSVKPGNIAELMAMPDIDGALVGGASLNAEDFSRIVRFEETSQ